VIEVEMAVAKEGRSRKLDAVPDARVVETVAEDRILTPEQRRDGADVRRVAAGEDERRLGSLEGGDLRLERLDRRVAPDDET
jgi:hypothetical protein